MKISNDNLMEILERSMGLTIGSNGIYYIQDIGVKKPASVYLNKDDMCMYECLIENSDVEYTQGGPNYKRMYIKNTDEYLHGTCGASSDTIKYIQDPGTKSINRVYLDKNNYRMYICRVESTTTVVNDSSFEQFNLDEVYNREVRRNDAPKKLMQHLGTANVNQSWTLNENANNFNFIIVRVISNPVSGNLDNGADCEDIVIHTGRSGYLYKQAYTGKMCIYINGTAINIGGSAGDNTFCAYGFAIFGVMRKK